MTGAATPPRRAEPLAGAWRGAAIALVLVAVAMRINNALRFRTGNGFDAVENFEYVRMLMGSWALPEPDAAWATSHPPLFYYLSALLWRVLAAVSLEQTILQAIPLLMAAAGLGAVAAAFALVRRLAPEDPGRAVVAAALLLFLPVHVYMSAMVGEELLVTLFVSLAIACTAWPLAARGGGAEPTGEGLPGLRASVAIGALVGLATLTKMTGALAGIAIAVTWLVLGARRGAYRDVLARGGAAAAVALAVGGWFYLRNLVSYGYLYPQDLEVHALMFELPPGARGVLDYLRLPLATLTDPQLLNPDLLRSVWGSTYATIWFDGHRHFLSNAVDVGRMGAAIGVLALLPTAAFLVGVARGIRRAVDEPGGVDTLLLSCVALFLAGYVAFTWGNPWYVTIKGSYLLGLSVPFAVYASEGIALWTGRGGALALGIRAWLAALAVAIAVTFTIGLAFTKLDGPGLPWREVPTPAAEPAISRSAPPAPSWRPAAPPDRRAAAG